MIKKIRRYIENNIVGILVYAPHGERGYGWGGTSSWEFNYVLYVNGTDRLNLFSKSFHNPLIGGIKYLLRMVALGPRRCSHCGELSYLAGKPDAHPETIQPLYFFDCELCGRNEKEEILTHLHYRVPVTSEEAQAATKG
mgnify:FL=1